MKFSVIFAIASAAFVAATPVAQPDDNTVKAATLVKRACGEGQVCAGLNNHGNCHV